MDAAYIVLQHILIVETSGQETIAWYLSAVETNWTVARINVVLELMSWRAALDEKLV
jgi:hypothetical protein